MTDFSTLYQEYAPEVLRFVIYLSGNRAEAEDITSETFVRAWTSPEPIRAETVKCYLFTIARDLYLHGLCKSKRHAELVEQMADPQASPLAQAEQKAEFRAVLAGLLELPETDRSDVLMRAVEGLSYVSISSMNLSNCCSCVTSSPDMWSTRDVTTGTVFRR